MYRLILHWKILWATRKLIKTIIDCGYNYSRKSIFPVPYLEVIYELYHSHTGKHDNNFSILILSGSESALSLVLIRKVVTDTSSMFYVNVVTAAERNMWFY